MIEGGGVILSIIKYMYDYQNKSQTVSQIVLT